HPLGGAQAVVERRPRRPSAHTTMINAVAKSIFLKGLARGVRGGSLALVSDRTYRFGPLHAAGASAGRGDPAGDLDAVMVIADDRFFARALARGDIGIGESYMDAEWRSPDLVPLIRLMLRNLSQVE